MTDVHDILVELIGVRTDNPGGDELALCTLLGGMLTDRGADSADVVSVPREPSGGGYVFARFGQPRTLINVHVDTVPANTGWTRDPFSALVTRDRIIGLGAADTKGAIAAVLVALERVRPSGVGVLFSGDEERSTTCLRAFIESGGATGVQRAIVCEPTRRFAGVRHRGVSGYRARYVGSGGHSSRADVMPKPIVTLARLAVALDAIGLRHLDAGPEGMKGLCMNVASLEGGVAFNVVPDEATLAWSVRPPPGFDREALDAELAAAMRAVDPSIEVVDRLGHIPFECTDRTAFDALLGDHTAGDASLDFWTEAAILAEHGVNAVVIGPGDIAQAHAADEWVSRDDLAWAIAMFTHVFSNAG